MDNLTHTLFGLTLARTPLGRGGRGTTAALLLASNAPDVDVVTVAHGAVNYLEWHRGPTHGVLGVVGLGIATAGLVLLMQRAVPAQDRRTDASAGRLLFVSVVGLFMHILMDVPTSYGIRILSPFDWHWFAADWVPIIDIYLLFILGGGLLAGRRSGRRSRQPSWATPAGHAALALAMMTGYYALRATAHEQALRSAPTAFGGSLPDRCSQHPRGLLDRWPIDPPKMADAPCLADLAAIPSFGSPFRWRLVARLPDALEVGELDLLERDGRRAPSGDEPPGPRRYPILPAPPEAARADTARVFLDFSRFPAMRLAATADGVTTVRWTDLRFGDPVPAPGQLPDRSGLFSVLVRVGPGGRVLEHRLGR